MISDINLNFAVQPPLGTEFWCYQFSQMELKQVHHGNFGTTEWDDDSATIDNVITCSTINQCVFLLSTVEIPQDSITQNTWCDLWNIVGKLSPDQSRFVGCFATNRDADANVLSGYTLTGVFGSTSNIMVNGNKVSVKRNGEDVSVYHNSNKLYGVGEPNIKSVSMSFDVAVDRSPYKQRPSLYINGIQYFGWFSPEEYAAEGFTVYYPVPCVMSVGFSEYTNCSYAQMIRKSDGHVLFGGDIDNEMSGNFEVSAGLPDEVVFNAVFPVVCP